MEWTDFVSFIWIPLLLVVGFGIRHTWKVAADLAAYKTEVAKHYTSIEHLKDVKDDIMKYLEKIERKLDRYANGK
jgi:hypothetical protein